MTRKYMKNFDNTGRSGPVRAAGVVILAVCLFLSAAPNIFADTVEELFEKGNTAYNKGDFKSAIQYYEAAVAENPKFAPAYYGLGLAYKETNTALPEVAWYLKAAVDLEPNFADAHNQLSKAYYGMGHFDKAEQHALKAIAINPNMLSAKFSLGWIYLLGKSDPKSAIFYFEQVLAATEIPYARFGLGMAYFMADERPKVLETITKLRNMKEDSLAVQLEDMFRGREYTPPSGPRPLVNIVPLPEKSGGVSLVPARPVVLPQEPAEDEPKDVGTSRIQLRGRLYNVNEPQEEESPAPGLNPLPSSTAPSTNETTAAERIRALQLQRKGSGY